MSYQRGLPTALLALAFGCGGTTQVTPDGGDGSASSSGSGSGSGSSGGNASSGASDGGGTSSSGGGSSGSSGGNSDSGRDAGTDAPFDAEIPDAFPESCGQFTLTLEPDAAPNTCAFTPADVKCAAKEDCTPYVVDIHCACIAPVYGTSRTNTVKCTPPPCVPPPPGGGGCLADASGYETQDCRLVADFQSVGVACVDHQCMTYAVGP